jgi:protein-tyrosine phosphatase
MSAVEAQQARRQYRAMKIGVLFVCTGNICRSPSAEGVLRSLAAQAGLQDALSIDSAGTYDGHVGEPPSRQAQVSATRRGYDLAGLRARQVTETDFAQFEYVLALDRGHYRALAGMAPSKYRERLGLLLDYAPELALRDVPDPWYGGAADYEHALDLIETACQGLLRHLRAQHFSA